MTLTGTGSKDGQTFSMRGSGDAENGQQLLEMHVDASAAGSGMHLDAIGDGETIYLTSPQFAGQIPGGKKWMKLDLGKAYAGSGLPSALTQSPSQALSVFKHAVHVVDLGTETVDGAPTTHYRVRLDYSKVLPKKLEKLTHASQETDQLWVGKSDGYVHRMQIAEGPLTMTMDFSNFGEQVHVVVPPASETFDATKMALGRLGG
jgi:outer membrane lipoprotein-sorting protein